MFTFLVWSAIEIAFSSVPFLLMKCSHTYLIKLSFDTVSESHTTAMCRLARVTATLSRLLSDRKPTSLLLLDRTSDNITASFSRPCKTLLFYFLILRSPQTYHSLASRTASIFS